MKKKKSSWVFVFLKYGKFWRFSTVKLLLINYLHIIIYFLGNKRETDLISGWCAISWRPWSQSSRCAEMLFTAKCPKESIHWSTIETSISKGRHPRSEKGVGSSQSYRFCHTKHPKITRKSHQNVWEKTRSSKFWWLTKLKY